MNYGSFSCHNISFASFVKKELKNLVLSDIYLRIIVHIFTLLLVPFASKSVNYSKRSESLKIRKKSKLAKAQCDSHN